MKYEHEEYTGLIIKNDDHMIFEFLTGNPHANVMPGGIMPSMYVATIGGKTSYRYPWHTAYTDKKLNIVEDFILSETGSIIYECIRSVMNAPTDFNLHAWKENMKMILVRISDQCTEKKAAEGISSALRSLLKLGAITYDSNNDVVTVVRQEKMRGIYTLYEECKKWLNSKEGGVTLRPTTDEKPKPTVVKKMVKEPEPKTVKESVSISIQDLINVSLENGKLYSVKPKMIKEVSSGCFVIEKGEISYAENESDVFEPVQLFRTVQEAAEVAFK